MPNNDSKIYFNGNEVVIAGSFNHEKKGHMVEIVGVDEKVPRKSLSIWELFYSSEEAAKEVFAAYFNKTPEQARDIDHKKGVLKTPLNLLKKRAMALA